MQEGSKPPEGRVRGLSSISPEDLDMNSYLYEMSIGKALLTTSKELKKKTKTAA